MKRRGKIFFVISTSILLIFNMYMFFTMEARENKVYDMMPSSIDALSDQVFDNLYQGDYKRTLSLFTQKLQYNLKDSLQNLSQSLRSYGQVKSSRTVGYYISVSYNEREHEVSKEIQIGDQYVLLTYIVEEEEGQYKISNIEMYFLENSLYNENHFSVKDMKWYHYIALLISGTLIVFTTYTASLSFSKYDKHKWKKAIFILLGVGMLTIDWKSGQMTVFPINIGMPVSAFSKTATVLNTYIIYRFPLGAILFWFKKEKNFNLTDIYEEEEDKIYTSEIE